MKTIETLEELEKACAEASELEPLEYVIRFSLDRFSNDHPLRVGFSTAIELIQKYQLPCSVGVRELPQTALARHGVLRDGTCIIDLSNKLTFGGDESSIRRAIIHEIAHHMAGPGHGHDDAFRRIASDLYEREGYPKGKRGDHRGNMC
jgi:hypothetical protein